MPWGVSNYNTNPALNTAINGTDISENCAAAGYNDALRQIMADIATWTAAQGVSFPISIANGGTASTTAAAALAALGGLGSQYRRLPQTAKSAAFTYDPSMDGGYVRYTGAAAAATIDTNANQAFVQDAIVETVNDGSGALTITPVTGVTLVWAANGSTGARTLATSGMAFMQQVAINRWYISGTGVS